jgi:hypothetical protein
MILQVPHNISISIYYYFYIFKYSYQSQSLRENHILTITDLGSLPADYPILNVITVGFGHYPSSPFTFRLRVVIKALRAFPLIRCVAFIRRLGSNKLFTLPVGDFRKLIPVYQSTLKFIL